MTIFEHDEGLQDANIKAKSKLNDPIRWALKSFTSM